MAGISIPYGRIAAAAPRARARGFPIFAPVSEQLVLWIGGGLIFITAVLNFYVFQVSVVATSAYEVQSLDRERDSWRARNQQLELELSKAQSLRWVEYDAGQRLGMVRSGEPVYLQVDAYARTAEGAPADAPSPVASGIWGLTWEWPLSLKGE